MNQLAKRSGRTFVQGAAIGLGADTLNVKDNSWVLETLFVA
jgi:hypothetical protein